ncbi:hypothetical protein CYMTET_13266 [Cymbomonas tetramitiformis]|uniref:Uncharacterized protein n=1 Tax=Cymbomonas tetramitiformis TaxID=36881 RepID=A0AAE0GK05_9CHLO|nr:hypothetical protein CYMTET_13266 [Cymbomonas tetramitiformis]
MDLLYALTPLLAEGHEIHEKVNHMMGVLEKELDESVQGKEEEEDEEVVEVKDDRPSEVMHFFMHRNYPMAGSHAPQIKGAEVPFSLEIGNYSTMEWFSKPGRDLLVVLLDPMTLKIRHQSSYALPKQELSLAIFLESELAKVGQHGLLALFQTMMWQPEDLADELRLVLMRSGVQMSGRRKALPTADEEANQMTMRGNLFRRRLTSIMKTELKSAKKEFNSNNHPWFTIEADREARIHVSGNKRSKEWHDAATMLQARFKGQLARKVFSNAITSIGGSRAGKERRFDERPYCAMVHLTQSKSPTGENELQESMSIDVVVDNYEDELAGYLVKDPAWGKYVLVRHEDAMPGLRIDSLLKEQTLNAKAMGEMLAPVGMEREQTRVEKVRVLLHLQQNFNLISRIFQYYAIYAATPTLQVAPSPFKMSLEQFQQFVKDCHFQLPEAEVERIFEDQCTTRDLTSESEEPEGAMPCPMMKFAQFQQAVVKLAYRNYSKFSSSSPPISVKMGSVHGSLACALTMNLAAKASKLEMSPELLDEYAKSRAQLDSKYTVRAGALLTKMVIYSASDEECLNHQNWLAFLKKCHLLDAAPKKGKASSKLSIAKAFEIYVLSFAIDSVVQEIPTTYDDNEKDPVIRQEQVVASLALTAAYLQGGKKQKLPLLEAVQQLVEDCFPE